MSRQIFLGSKKPLPVSIAAGLAALKPEVLPDFSKILLVLPGKVARRSVQKELLGFYPHGVLLPQLLTPHLLMHYELPQVALPPAAAGELIWGKVLTRAAAHAEDFPEIFPGGKIPVEKFSAGTKLHQLRMELAAGGFSIADAAGFLGSRGGELSRLEYMYCRELENCGFTDPLVCDRQAVQDISAFAGVEKVILAGLPDLPRMLQQKLDLIDGKYPGLIEVWIGDDETRADFYTPWGVPVAEKWEKRAFECDIRCIHTAIDPADGARRAMLLAAENGVIDPSECAIVLADQSLYEDFAEKFAALHDLNGQKITVADPSGASMGLLRLCRLWSTLLEYLKNPDDFLCADALIRQEDFLNYAAGTPEKCRKLLVQLDGFRQNSMPDDSGNALKLLSDQDQYQLLTCTMQLLVKWKQRFDQLAPWEFLREFFTEVYRKRTALAPVKMVEFDQECRFFTGILENFSALPEKLTAGVDKIQLMEVALRNCRNEKITIPLPPGAIYFEGRLEMPFLTQKRIIFCGMNERLFPDRIDITPFLTDTIRSQLGIRSNRETFARSLCHLMSVANAREPGDLQLIVLRNDGENAALRPSGILFGGELPENDLLARCTKLFRDPESLVLPEKIPGRREFFLMPQLDFKSGSNGQMVLSVTDLDAYLNSPFDFWRERVHDMQSTDYDLCEPDNALGGTLCHEAFEQLPCGRRFPSAEALEKCLAANFDQTLHQRFGTELPVLIRLYAANMKQRFTYGARQLFQSQSDGFELLATEYKFGGEKGSVNFAGAEFHGKVDRIEYHRQRNILRVIDIKTGKVDDVIKEHCNFNRQKQLTGFSRLQLPAYVLLLKCDPAFRELCPQIDTAEIECAYLTMPSEVTASRLEIWPADKLSEVLPQAETAIRQIVEEIRKFPEQTVYGEPEKISSPAIQPDGKTALRGINWLTPGEKTTPTEEIAEKISKKSAPSNNTIPTSKPFPALPGANAAGKSRCCDCPPEIRAGCSCSHGTCAGCKSFNGFKRFNIITASAGTGKTYSLASRFIQLLNFGADPESILALTFTKKAAGEIFDRVVKRICDMAIKPDQPDNACLQMDKKRIITLIRELLGFHAKELQISTIDSFFMQLLQAFAPELGIWGSLNMTDENDDRLMRQTLHRWIRSISDPVQLDALRELLKEAASGDTRSIHATLCDLTGSIHEFYQLKIRSGSDGSWPQLDNCHWYNLRGSLSAEEITDLRKKLLDAAEKPIDTKGVMNRRLTALAGQLERCVSGVMYGKPDDDTDELLKMLNEKNGGSWLDDPADAPLTYTRGCNAPPSLAGDLRRAFRHIRAAALRQCRAKNLAVFALIREYDRIYGKFVRSAGNVSFSDIPALLTNMDEETGEIILGSPDHSLEFRLDRQIKHYMFDEFQDTSDVQMQVFEPLIKELFSQLTDGDFRTFFCVGDLKQSIYQWRGGNPELFNYVTNLLRPIGEELGYDPTESLFCSYRSSQAVLDTVNAVFSTYYGELDTLAPVLARMDFLPHISFDQEMPGHTALVNVAQATSRSAQNIPGKSAVMAAILEKIRPLSRGLTVGVLVPTNSTGREFAAELKNQYHLPVSIDGTITPVDSMGFALFRQLLILAAHPGDKEAEKFLEMLCFSAPEESPQKLDAAILAEKLKFVPGIPLADAVREDIFINGLSGFAGRFLEAFAAECTAYDRSRLEILYEAACKFSGTSDEFLRQIDHLGRNDTSLDETIQIMTCHKAKGLEFDIVFMPDPAIHYHGGGSGLPEAEIIHYNENGPDHVASPSWVSFLPNKNIANTLPGLANHLKMKESDRILEKCCTLYVTMTRAKSALYILTSRNNTSGAFSPDKLLLEQLPLYGVQNSDTELHELLAAPEIAQYSPELLYSHGDWHWYIRETPELKDPASADDRRAIRFPDIKPSDHREVTASGGKDALFVPVPELRFAPARGKNIGTQVHELFEKLRFIDGRFDPAGFCAEHNAEPVAAEIFTGAMAADSPIRQIFAEPAGEYELWCEKRFLLINRNGETVPGAFDRVLIHKENGRAVSAEIFDYKSDRFEGEKDYEVYFSQLASYRESLSILLGISPDAVKCFIVALKIKKIITV